MLSSKPPSNIQSSVPITALLIAALFAPACGGDASGSGGGGSGAGGSTATGGSGGMSTGGSGGMSTGGSGGGASAEDIAACQSLCSPDTCTDNVCMRSERVDAFAMRQGVTDLAAGYSEVNLARVCRTMDYGVKVHVFATDGACVVLETALVSGMLGTSPLDAGTITMDTPTSGKNELSPQDDCWVFETTPDPLFSAGETVTVDAAGGADFPAFSAQATAPEEFDLTAPSKLTVGQEYTLSWTGGGALDYVLIAAGDRSIYCHGDAQSEIKISGALTSLIEPPSNTGAVLAYRRNTAKVEVAPGKKAQLSVLVVRQTLFEYAQ